ncbi:MAG: DNA-processing protein DprA, partial [Candidatus Omnitrophota bacterium]
MFRRFKKEKNMIFEEIRKIEKGTKEYPSGLMHIHNAPEELFVNGTILPQDVEAIAIVGTRRATEYGMKQAEKIAFELALMGITIVSGMAKGIDTAAHTGALKAGGRTIAILGSGHDNIYPKENMKLYERIVKSGAVVSELPRDIGPLRQNFPMRNRIISGMSKGVVVIEAPRKSGALITANFALEQGRTVFAMPGNIDSPESTGSNLLIKEGACLVENVSDIIDELKYIMDINSIPLPTEEDIYQKPDHKLSFDENKIYDILCKDPKSIDEISDKAKV